MGKRKTEWNNVDEWVWFMEDNKPVRKEIRGVYRDGYNNKIEYLFGKDRALEQMQSVSWLLCFNTKEQLLASL